MRITRIFTVSRRLLTAQRQSTLFSTLKDYEIEAIEKGRNRLQIERDNAKRLLNEREYPIASFSPETWFEAQELLPFWTTQRSVESVHYSFSLLDRLLLEQLASNNTYQPTWLQPYIILQILNNWRIVSWNHEMPDYTPLKVWDRLEKIGLSIPLNEKMYYFVIEAQTRQSKVHPEFCEKLMERCQRQWKNGVEACKPTAKLYQALLLAWNKSNDPKAVERVQEILKTMPIPPNRRIYSLVIHTLAQHGQPLLAQNVLERMYIDFQGGAKDCQPGIDVFTSIIAAWGKSGAKDAAQQADSVLEEMMRLRKNNELQIDRPHSLQGAFNAAMICHGSAQTKEGALRAQDLFEKLKQSKHQPDEDSYGSLIRAWARIGDCEKAESILLECIEQYDKHNSNVKPTSAMFGEVIRAWMRSKHPQSEKREKAKNVFRTLEIMADDTLKPDVFVFNTLIECISFCRGSADELISILCRMQDMAKAGMENVAPNVYTYDVIFQGLRLRKAGKEIDEVWLLMWENYRLSKKAARPTQKVINTVLAAYGGIDGTVAERKEMAEKPFALFEEMKQAHDEGLVTFVPDVYTYASLLTCLARANQPERAADLLEEMRERYRHNARSPRPNRICYNAALDAWARMSNPEEVAKVLSMMHDDFLNGNPDAKLGRDSFNILIKAWAQSKSVNSGKKAKYVLKRMVDLAESGQFDTYPDVISYTTCIVALGFSSRFQANSNAPLEAEKLLRELDNLHKQGKTKEGANKRTYSSLIKAWKSSKHPEKDTRINSLKEEALARFGSF